MEAVVPQKRLPPRCGSCKSTLAVVSLLAIFAGCFAAPNENRSSDSTHQEKTTNEGSGGEPASAAGQDWKNWQNQLQEMADTLNLDEQEKAALADAFSQQQNILENWWAESGEKLRSLEEQLKTAVRQRDLNALNRIKNQAAPLRQRLQDLLAESQQAILESLSAEKRDLWQAHLLEKQFLQLIQSIELSPEQIARIKELARHAVEQVRNEPNPQAAGFLKLEKSIEQQVFDAVQKRAYEKIKQKNPLRSLQNSLFGG